MSTRRAATLSWLAAVAIGAAFIVAAVVVIAIPAVLVYVVLLSTFAFIGRSIFHDNNEH